MNKFIKQLFCKHEYTKVINKLLTDDSFVLHTKNCFKCDKVKLNNDLNKKLGKKLSKKYARLLSSQLF